MIQSDFLVAWDVLKDFSDADPLGKRKCFNTFNISDLCSATFTVPLFVLDAIQLNGRLMTKLSKMIPGVNYENNFRMFPEWVRHLRARALSLK